MSNLAASVRQRLANRAQAARRPFQELMQYYAMERLLYRLSVSPHADRFVLKGALLLVAWRAPQARPTVDIDLLGHADNHVEAITEVFRHVCRQPVEPDGLVFPAERVQGVRIKEDAEYEGVRLRFAALLENARVPMQVDIGFGDVVTPAPVELLFPTLLPFPPPTLRAYPPETVVAEKLEAMVRLGLLNSRMKDFYDLALLARTFGFDGRVLKEAITRTFACRGTPVEREPVAWTTAFFDDQSKQAQWQAFLRRLPATERTAALEETIASVRAFLGPILDTMNGPRTHPGHWHVETQRWLSRRETE